MSSCVQHDPTTFGRVDLSIYNGKITAHNPATGNHRTFDIRTVRRGGLKGKRIIRLLRGSDNQSEYTAFGFVTQKGRVVVWKKHRGSQYDHLASFLNHADYHAAVNGVQFKMSVRCRRCNRELTDPESIDLGIGPVCRGEG